MPEDSERTIAARLAANTRWAHEPDRAAATAPATAGLLAKFAADVDPTGILPPAERAKRAENARRAHMLRLSLASAKARRKAAELIAQAAAAEVELSDMGATDAIAQ